MKKDTVRNILAVTGIFALTMCMTGCNKQLVDLTYAFDKAVIVMGDEVITVDIASWTDFDDGDQLQIKAKDGTVYLVHSMNCTLIKSAN